MAIRDVLPVHDQVILLSRAPIPSLVEGGSLEEELSGPDKAKSRIMRRASVNETLM